MNTPRTPKIAATFSRGVLGIPSLNVLLGVEKVLLNPSPSDVRQIEFIVGWGQKQNTQKARRFALTHSLPFVALEDGFLRSLDLGVNGSPPLSIITDEIGVYYDATAPSRLENLLNTSGDSLDDPALLARAVHCMKAIRTHRLSKYNNSPVDEVHLPPSPWSQKVLVIDQTANDMSLIKGMMHESGFQGMLDAALNENPEAQIILKIHPDVVAGKKASNFHLDFTNDRICVLSRHVNPIALLSAVDKVYTMTSQMGFEALIMNKPVTCFGAPFYSNWGLTDDRVVVSRRTQKRSLAQLFAAAYILYPRYLHPDLEAAGEIEDVIEHLALQRQHYLKNAGNLFCFGFSKWKQGYIRRFLASTSNRLTFCRTAQGARNAGFARGDISSDILVCWGARGRKQIDKLRGSQTPLWRVEDGFMRSISLGSDFTAPASLVVDKRGIYFDPRQPSDLEHILKTHLFTEEEKQRAEKLRQTILKNGLSKYNITQQDRLQFPADQKVILVPGQVESDASIAAGCIDIRTNEQLVAAARQQNPNAFIAYKPHPDVVAQNRKGKTVYGSIPQNCDVIIEDESIAACIRKSDEIHTMTSLVGFEALMQEKKVVTYGQPFYAGWGLTIDRHPHPRRDRTLALAELIFGTMVLYPSYINWKNNCFTTPEFIVQTLAKEMQQRNNTSPKGSLVRQLHRLRNLCRGMLNAK